MKIFSQLESAQIQNVVADPTPTATTVGRVIYRTDTNQYKICDSTPAWRTIFLSLDGSLTFTGLAATPGTNPAAGDYKVYFKTDGNAYFLDENGVERLLGSALTTNGDILYYNSGDQRLPVGSDNQILSVQAGLPSWIGSPLINNVTVDAAGNGGGAISPAATNIDFTEITDTDSAWSGSVFTASDDMVISLMGQISFTATAVRNVYLYLDTGSGLTQYRFIGTVPGNSTTNAGFNANVNLSSGDSFSIRVTNNGGTLSNSVLTHWIVIKNI